MQKVLHRMFGLFNDYLNVTRVSRHTGERRVYLDHWIPLSPESRRAPGESGSSNTHMVEQTTAYRAAYSNCGISIGTPMFPMAFSKSIRICGSSSSYSISVPPSRVL